MFKRLFWKEAGIEIQPDGTRVQRWQRRSPRGWLIMKLVGKRAVLANQPIRSNLTLYGTEEGFLVFGNCLYEGGSLHIIRGE